MCELTHGWPSQKMLGLSWHYSLEVPQVLSINSALLKGVGAAWGEKGSLRLN